MAANVDFRLIYCLWFLNEPHPSKQIVYRDSWEAGSEVHSSEIRNQGSEFSFQSDLRSGKSCDNKPGGYSHAGAKPF
jgi:hypothetical protein